MIRWIAGFALLASCGADSNEADDRDSGALADATPGEPTVKLQIDFDYRYDTTGFFADGARRRTLEAAAVSWGRLLGDDFPSIPSGTSVRTRDPQNPDGEGITFEIDREIDDVLVFVGCSEIDGPGGTNAISNHAAALASVSDSELRNALNLRYRGADFQPWTGWISFDCGQEYFFDETFDSADDIPLGITDFYSVTMHELAHVLGFGTSDAFVTLQATGPIRFTGPSATADYGGDVPLSSSGTHYESGVAIDGVPVLMDPSRPGGFRTEPTSLDIAALTDIGYERVD
tara:strand:- start:168955 stop:169818 length:864 start_codon:yes stop_codon:yes gene_type:complete